MKETFEKTAKSKYLLDIWEEEESLIRKLAFSNGVKWKAEQMYSEEDMKKSYYQGHKSGLGSEKALTFNDFLKQLKKINENINIIKRTTRKR
jgi:hypothetical protein